jgi:hypothetical protein
VDDRLRSNVTRTLPGRPGQPTSSWGQSLIGISASKPPANHDPAMRRIVGGKAVDGNVTSPDPNKRGVRSVFLQVAIVLGRKPSSNLTDPSG